MVDTTNPITRNNKFRSRKLWCKKGSNGFENNFTLIDILVQESIDNGDYETAYEHFKNL